MAVSLNHCLPNTSLNARLIAFYADLERNLIYFVVDERNEAKQTLYQWNLATHDMVEIASGVYGPFPCGVNDDHTLILHPRKLWPW